VWEILPDLFLGDRCDAGERAGLVEQRITHIVNCSKELPCHFESEFTYLWLRMDDPDPGFGAMIGQFCDFIDTGRASGRVMVHCTGGVSRSPAVILAYLCHLEGDLEKAVRLLSKAVQTGIDEDFLFQLGQFRGDPFTPEAVKALQNRLLGRC
jgi:hypothetical protein